VRYAFSLPDPPPIINPAKLIHHRRNFKPEAVFVLLHDGTVNTAFFIIKPDELRRGR